MKHIIIIITFITFSISINAQEKEQLKEFGITFYDLEKFGINYKFGTTKSVWRVNTVIANGKIESSNYNDERELNKTINLGFSFGKEYLKRITERLEFRFGVDFSYDFYASNLNFENWEYNFNHSIEKINHTTGVNFVLGLNYVFKNNLIIGAEALPGLKYYIRNTVNSEIETGFEENFTYSNFIYDLSNNTALLSLSYRF